MKKTEEINVYIFKPKEYKELKGKYRPYLYNEKELKLAEKIVKELENKLKNEYQLIEKLNKYYKYEDFMKEIKKEIINGRDIENLLKYWEMEFDYFFTAIADVEKNKELFDEIFNLRGGKNILSIPDPRIIEDEKTRKELYDLLTKWDLKLSFEERQKLFFNLKRYLIPVPIWILKKYVDIKEKGFPVFYSTNLRYSDELGLYFTEEIAETYIF